MLRNKHAAGWRINAIIGIPTAVAMRRMLQSNNSGMQKNGKLQDSSSALANAVEQTQQSFRKGFSTR
jgi:hypothetical protein